ncbi:NmrA family NAD(P)-binding protein [Thalassospira mesophila]|uniref:NmrA family transcriptional regulator n=1 Tax=Thalassospira mesophila TaxID=1293891 RepID=A0A1Y2L4D7_9PROT|nr:NmrA family NAD(P)-binding protein [Thalassospira mesophila]OSQ40706.1 NmrA family transcriptional regulator [Thalassospira mesophila]
MYAITGITGQVGSNLARQLLSQGHKVRAVVRDAVKGQTWADLGCEMALADMNDTPALTRALGGAKGVFILLPPNFDPSPDFRESKAIIASLCQALADSKPERIICLSTIGAQASQPNLLAQLGLMEQALSKLDLDVTFLRAAWFMENALWDIAPARDTGVIPSFLQPLDKPVPMVATRDIAALAAALLTQPETPAKIVELEGPARITPNQIAADFARSLGKPVRAKIVPRDQWEQIFRAQGMTNPTPRAQMLDGFNQGWIEFENAENTRIKGNTRFADILPDLILRVGM